MVLFTKNSNRNILSRQFLLSAAVAVCLHIKWVYMIRDS